MASAILPASLIKTRYLTMVRESLWAVARQRKTEWVETWDVACWLHFSDTPAKPVALVLRYTDEDGSHAAIIDEAKPNGSAELMFSGRLNLPGKGRVTDMSLHCTGVPEAIAIQVENLHISPVQPKVAKVG